MTATDIPAKTYAGTAWRVETTRCAFCGSDEVHPATWCPEVLEVEFFDTGVLRRVVKRS